MKKAPGLRHRLARLAALAACCAVLAWLTSLTWTISLVACALVADRLLLWMEAAGWINYRRVGLSRGAATYHTLELSSIFDPGFQEIMEVKYADETSADASGDPPA